jgi:hypothetical protein
MPRPKGFEPFSRLYVVRWGVLGSQKWSPNTNGDFFTHPRVAVFPTRGAADSQIATLNSLVGYGPLRVRAGSIVAPDGPGPNGAENFYNRKVFVSLFVAGLAEGIQEAS